MASFEFKIFLYFIIILSSVLHEYFHGYLAYYLGDPTAKYAGRLTLNPLKHLDLVGTVLLPLFLLFAFGGFIGWAKPVPYNPYNLRDQKYGSTKVALAGPLANFLIAAAFALFLRFFPIGGFLYVSLSWVIYINIILGLFNLIPVPPLDGSKLIMDAFPRLRQMYFSLERSFLGIFLAIIFAARFLPLIAALIFRLFSGSPFLPLTF